MTPQQRFLALLSALGVLLWATGALLLPAAPTLVCRVTGELMPALAVPHGDPCCQTAPILDADGEVAGWRLIAPGCCDLKVSPAAPHAPAILSPTFENAAASIFWAPAPPRPTPPIFADVVRAVRLFEPSIPRAPPRRASVPRAPPVFS